MNFQKLIEFRYLRDVVVILAVQKLDYSVSQALEIKAGQNLVFSSEQDNSLFLEYRNCRNTIFPNSKFLFTTEDGEHYLSNKFFKNTTKLLLQAGVKASPHYAGVVEEINVSYATQQHQPTKEFQIHRMNWE